MSEFQNRNLKSRWFDFLILDLVRLKFSFWNSSLYEIDRPQRLRPTNRSIAVNWTEQRDKPRTTRGLPWAWHTTWHSSFRGIKVAGSPSTPSYNSKQVKRWKTGSCSGARQQWFCQAILRYGRRNPEDQWFGFLISDLVRLKFPLCIFSIWALSHEIVRGVMQFYTLVNKNSVLKIL